VIDDASSREMREAKLRKEIEDYYLPKQLVDAIYEIGGIPRSSVEMPIGIGFIDIADYTYLSKFLSPKENQVLLNGLYTAFNVVLKRHGGYLNKIEGDSLMFHFGGPIDPKVKELAEDEALRHISRELFYTCVEMQRVCLLFNQANDKFLEETATRENREDLQRAFDIISSLRTSVELASSLNALFQIRIRIGANVGVVTLGNFGPEGAKQWDVVGIPVIDAKRMESTAPIGGLRISEAFYGILEQNGIVQSYFDRFKREALVLGGYYREITMDELFKFSHVQLKDKKNAQFTTYSVQVNPALPENIRDQVSHLLDKGAQGADIVIELLQYYRGNRYVIDAVEAACSAHNVEIHKGDILNLLQPKRYREMAERFQQEPGALERYIDGEYSLFELFLKLGRYQDYLKQEQSLEKEDYDFISYDHQMSVEKRRLEQQFEYKRQWVMKRTYFYSTIYPLVFSSIRCSILDYQSRSADLEAV
jgi:class 3 adenylate cyclase